jgi:mannose-6-phosphate isomerase-like protein (cupin superfamily)
MDSNDIPVVPKVWGEEHWIVNREYCGKKLILKQGFRCSMHYHKVKDETFYVVKGRVLLETEAGDYVMVPGDSRHIPQRLLHRFSGLEDSEIIEFSTHHEDADSYRTEPSGPFDLAAVRLPGAPDPARTAAGAQAAPRSTPPSRRA